MSEDALCIILFLFAKSFETFVESSATRVIIEYSRYNEFLNSFP